MTTMKYAASGEQRKQLVNALSEVIGRESKYLKAPSYGYEVGSCIVNRTGDIEFPDNMAEEEIEAIVKKLRMSGIATDAIKVAITVLLGMALKEFWTGLRKKSTAHLHWKSLLSRQKIRLRKMYPMPWKRPSKNLKMF